MEKVAMTENTLTMVRKVSAFSFLRALWGASIAWTVDSDGNIRFRVTSNGMTPQQWVQYLNLRGWHVTDMALSVLELAREAPTRGVTYDVVVITSKSLGIDITREKVRVAAKNKGWISPHWEVACLIRDALTDEQLKHLDLNGIFTMHEPIKFPSDNSLGVLLSSTFGLGGTLNADHYHDWLDDGTIAGNIGFAFLLPQE